MATNSLDGRHVAVTRPGGYRYEFEVRYRSMEAQVVINCLSPGGHCSRISVDRVDLASFIAGLQEAADAISAGSPHALVIG